VGKGAGLFRVREFKPPFNPLDPGLYVDSALVETQHIGLR
jgi:hypothetical protein